MKSLLPILSLLLLVAVLFSPAAALSGARAGIDLWWRSLFPALLPCFICVKLAENTGLLNLAARHPRIRAVVLMGFSLVSGAPTGARLLYSMVQSKQLSRRQASALLSFINAVSPLFLFTIIASELLKNKGMFRLMALSFYGCTLLLALPSLIFHETRSAERPGTYTRSLPFSEALTKAIEGSMLDIIKVGGCVAFACALLSIARPLIRGEKEYAALAVAMEVSSGAAAVAALSIPLRLKVSFLIGGAAFGGLSLGLQAICCFPEAKLLPYLLKKCIIALVTGLACYALFPLFPDAEAVFASHQEVLFRASAMGGLFLASGVSLGFIFLLALMAYPQKNM